MFYRVTRGENTFVFPFSDTYDAEKVAEAVYTVLMSEDFGTEVKLELVTEYGDVWYTRTRTATSDAAELAHREYAYKNGYNEHGFKVGSF